MKCAILLCGLLATGTAVAAVPSGSCQFESLFAPGCIEFFDATSEQASTDYCQEQQKPGLTAVLATEACDKPSTNTLCTVDLEGGATAAIYSNDMPGFVCKNFLDGTLTKRPATGW